jgi:hypothetical protein
VVWDHPRKRKRTIWARRDLREVVPLAAGVAAAVRDEEDVDLVPPAVEVAPDPLLVAVIVDGAGGVRVVAVTVDLAVDLQE